MKQENITVVIPTKGGQKIHTLESVPDGVEVLIQHEEPIAKARNRGVERAQTDYIVQLDDDIQFAQDVWDDLIDAMAQNRIAGMEDWDFGLIVTRMIGFHRNVWKAVGGFDEQLGSHMEDTDFAIKLEQGGYDLTQISRDRIKHIPHESRINTTDRVWRLAYLCLKHPRYAPMLIRGIK